MWLKNQKFTLSSEGQQSEIKESELKCKMKGTLWCAFLLASGGFLAVFGIA